LFDTKDRPDDGAVFLFLGSQPVSQARLPPCWVRGPTWAPTPWPTATGC